MKRPTLHDVAGKAGVSHMTVSRVLHQAAGVKIATRDKVRQAIRETGYRPDPALSALAAYRSKEGGGRGSVLAFLDCDGTPYSGVVLEGVKSEASLLGYTVESFRLKSDSKEQTRLNRMFYHRGIQGLFFGPSDEPRVFSGWDWKEFAVVSLGALNHQPAMHAVALDYFQGATRGSEILKSFGCRKIGMIIDPKLEARSGHRWRGGYVAGLAGKQKIRIYPHPQRDAASLRRWVKRESVDGVLTIHDEVHQALHGSGVRMVFLNDQNRNHDCPRVQLDPRHIGAEGVRLLHHSLLRREFGLPVEPKMVALLGAWFQG